MEEKKELKPIAQAKEIKQNHEQKTQTNQKPEMEVIVAYAQVAVHTLQNSATEITSRAIREEIKMFYNKFGNEEIKKLANAIVKEKKERKEKK